MSRHRFALGAFVVFALAAASPAPGGSHSAKRQAKDFPTYRIDISVLQTATWTIAGTYDQSRCDVEGAGVHGVTLKASAVYTFSVGDASGATGSIHPSSTPPNYGNSARADYQPGTIAGNIKYACDNQFGNPGYSGELQVPLKGRLQDRPTAFVAWWKPKAWRDYPLCPELGDRPRKVLIPGQTLLMQPPSFGISKTQNVEGLFPSPPFHCAYIPAPTRQMLGGRPFTVRTTVEKTDKVPTGFYHQLSPGKVVRAEVFVWRTSTHWTVKFTPCRVTKARNGAETGRCPGMKPIPL